MKDREAVALAATQFNRFSRAQLVERGWTPKAIDHRVKCGRFVVVEDAVYAIAPVLEDRWGRWMGATLTAPDTYLALWSAASAYGLLDRERPLITVMRPGRAGPRRHGGLLIYLRPGLEHEVGTLRGIPITSPERTLLDLAQYLGRKALARALREAIRLGHCSLERITDFALAHPRRRGTRRLLSACAAYAGLPVERARSGAEVRALLVLREAGIRPPQLNVTVAGAEADLVWRDHRHIVEIDGRPFHQDRGEDRRKEEAWRAGGFDVVRITSDDVYEHPDRLLALLPPALGYVQRPSRGAGGTRSERRS